MMSMDPEWITCSRCGTDRQWRGMECLTSCPCMDNRNRNTEMEFEHSAGMLISFDTTQAELRRPFYLCRATMEKFGNDWRAVYGDVQGFGKTPQLAAIAFDLVWLNGSIEKAALAQ